MSNNKKWYRRRDLIPDMAHKYSREMNEKKAKKIMKRNKKSLLLLF
jgi:hypothetical protein